MWSLNSNVLHDLIFRTNALLCDDLLEVRARLLLRFSRNLDRYCEYSTKGPSYILLFIFFQFNFLFIYVVNSIVSDQLQSQHDYKQQQQRDNTGQNKNNNNKNKETPR
jgi:hypothetical protein